MTQTPGAAQPPGAATERFRALAAADWRWRLEQFPRLASAAGVREQDHRLERMDGASRAARLAQVRCTLAELAAIDTAALEATERVNHAVLKHQLEVFRDEAELGGELMPIDGDQSFYSYLGELWREQPLDSAEAVQRHIERLRAIPQYFADHIELLEEAAARGLMPPQVVLQGRERPLVPVAEAERGEDTPFHRALAAQWQRWPALGERAARVIEAEVLPAYRRLLAFLRERYLPQARAGTAARELPGGEAFYAARLRGFTTLALGAREVHEEGLAEVGRIEADMRRLMAECRKMPGWGAAVAPSPAAAARSVGGAADGAADGAAGLGAFLAALRADARQYPKTPEELLGAACWIAKRVDARLPRYFGVLPRQPFGVEPVPEALAPFYTSGRYVPAPIGGEQPALYWVNTHRLESRALYSLPALTLHEAVPGHHLQFALTAEDTTLAPYRRWDGTLSAHTEGWALYAEFLGTEMGIYRTPLEELGRASYEMWRACRLVVDTGLHMLGWSRERAMAWLRDRTALSEHEITTEVDRYIGWPGQALSYKMGEIRIRRLRSRLEAAEGSAFSLKRFHDRLLALGPVPLPTLERELTSTAAAPRSPAAPATAPG